MVFKPIRNGVSSIPVGNNLRPSYDHRSLRQTAVSGCIPFYFAFLAVGSNPAVKPTRQRRAAYLGR